MERVTLLDVEAIHQQAGTRIDARYLMFRKPSTSELMMAKSELARSLLLSGK